MITHDKEEQHIAAGRGKWSKPGVPHKGWHCVDIEDLGAPLVECGMCESQSIRYVHYMSHPRYEEVLEVGCICAGHMEGNYQAAKSREASMKSRASKRKRWLTRKWKVSQKGNPWLEADGFRIVVYCRGSKWSCTITKLGSMTPGHMRREFKTEEQAKLGAFDEVTRLISLDDT
jgi:hypothetical protein